MRKEKQDGNVEYKRHLLIEQDNKLAKRVTQLEFRLTQGQGTAIYYIGIDDDGQTYGLTQEQLTTSLEYLNSMAKEANAVVSESEQMIAKSVDVMNTNDEMIDIRNSDAPLFYAKVVLKVRTEGSAVEREDIRIGVCGNVDAGKSTCIGVLTSGELDNGRGSARTCTQIHRHEIETGRTSTVSHHTIGFKDNGAIVNYDRFVSNNLAEITKNSTKLITLCDLAGHEKYLRTMIYGIASSALDYSFVLVNAKGGITHMTQHHLTISAMMNIPVIILMTKIDNCPHNKYTETLQDIRKLVGKSDICKKVHVVNTLASSDELSKLPDSTLLIEFLKVDRQRVIPVIPVSFVDGTSIDLLKESLHNLPKRRRHLERVDAKLEFIIDRTYQVPGIGLVIHGFVNQGTVRTNQVINIGPLNDGKFITSNVRSIHYNCISVNNVRAGNYACLAIKIPKNQHSLVRRGQVAMESIPTPVITFWAKLNIVSGQSTTIQPGYCPHLHIVMVKQSAKVLEIKDVMNSDSDGSTVNGSVNSKVNTEQIARSGRCSLVKFAFTKPEYIRKGMRLLFRDGKVKGVGIVYNT